MLFNPLETRNAKGVPVEVIRNCSPRFIIRKILYLVENQKVKLSSIALIYRNNYLSSFIEQELLSNNIPYEILGSFKFIEREEIKDVLAYLKTIAFQNESDAFFLRVLKGLVGVGHKLIENIEDASRKNGSGIFTYLSAQFSTVSQLGYRNLKVSRLQQESLLNIVKSMNYLIERTKQKSTLENFVGDLLQELNYFVRLEQKTNPLQRKRNVQQFLNLIREWEKERVVDKSESLCDVLGDFLHYCSIVFEDSNFQTRKNNLVLSSVHQVKGLEFDFVFFLYLDHNILPYKISTDLTEEKRLFYVGITRTKKSLYLVSNSNIPSVFFDSLLEENH